MAAWVKMIGCPVEGIPGVSGSLADPGAGLTGAGPCIEQDFPNRNGTLMTGNGCALHAERPGACPEAALPPGDGTAGVHDGFLCF